MLHKAIEVRDKGGIHGNGLFSTKLIAQGELVWKLDEATYSFSEIEQWDAKRRKSFDWYGFQCGVDRYSSPKDISREMNHSCDPNTWWAGSYSLIAREDIYPNEEITYDYSTCDIDLPLELECHCGSSICRKKVTNKDYLNSKWQEQYGSHLPAHVLNAIENID